MAAESLPQDHWRRLLYSYPTFPVVWLLQAYNLIERWRQHVGYRYCIPGKINSCSDSSSRRGIESTMVQQTHVSRALSRAVLGVLKLAMDALDYRADKHIEELTPL